VLNTSGSFNIAIGYQAAYNLTNGNNNIDIGSVGVADESGVIRIGTNAVHTATYIAGISGATVPSGISAIIDSSGHLGTSTSSRRFKDAIHGMGSDSDVLMSLHPVSFRYKHDIDPQGIPQFGLVAEEVEKVAPELVVRDASGAAYSVRYEQVNAMLLNEFLKEHHQVQEQQTQIQTLSERLIAKDNNVAVLERRLADLETRLQKVSEQVEQSKAAPMPAANIRNSGGM
jgi:hypothetical protein